RVEAELLVLLEVEREGLVRRGGVDAVRPVALVQRRQQEQHLAVERDVVAAVLALRDTDLAHAEVRADGVDHAPAGVPHAYLQVVEVGVVRGPQVRVRHPDGELVTHRAAGPRDDLPLAAPLAVPLAVPLAWTRRADDDVDPPAGRRVAALDGERE